MNDNELLDYFKGLSIRDILQLARKSIVLTTENRELEDKIAKYANINEQDTKDYAILFNKMEKIKKVITTCENNTDEILCCDCSYADKCRLSDEEYSSYDITKYIKEIINS